MPNEMPKWRQEVEEILGKKFPDEETAQEEMADRLLELLEEMSLPTGVEGALVMEMLIQAALDLSPLSATFAGFTIGVIYSRYQDKRRFES